MKKIIVGYSGGLDSTAILLDFVQQNYKVYAVYIKLNEDEDIPLLPEQLQEMGVELIVLDKRDLFRRSVIRYFADSYKKGITPNPCAMCNRYIKFALLSEYADEHSYDGFSTGHYICINNGFIENAADRGKDQSYFVSTVKKQHLGNFINSRNCNALKEENRKYVTEAGISISGRESQDICFIKHNYIEFLERNMGFRPIPGDFIDEHGNQLGRYDEYYRFTIGMRKGFKQGFNKKMYVKKIDIKNRCIVLTDKDKMKFRGFRALIISRFSDNIIPDSVKTRYRQKALQIDRLNAENNMAECFLKSDANDITPGQIAVFYKNNRVIMSAEIIKAIE